MELSEFIPEQPVFTLSSTGKSYELRIPNLEDRMVMANMAGGQAEIQKVFSELKWDVICRIVYRLLIDKSDFLATAVEEIDDEGNKKKFTATGPQMLMRAIKSQDDGIKMLGALTAAITNGEPLIKEYVRNEVKKNTLNQTGPNSLTSSQVNTDTPQPNSEPLPTAS
jgi:hypothetical protein